MAAICYQAKLNQIQSESASRSKVSKHRTPLAPSLEMKRKRTPTQGRTLELYLAEESPRPTCGSGADSRAFRAAAALVVQPPTPAASNHFSAQVISTISHSMVRDTFP